jgi:hypothetical protein
MLNMDSNFNPFLIGHCTPDAFTESSLNMYVVYSHLN